MALGRKDMKSGGFRDKVAFNSAQRRSKAANYGHLLVPRGINVFKEEAPATVFLDFLPYFVTDDNHPERDDDRGVALKGTLWYKRPYKLHRNVGPENVTVVCPTSIGKKCPVCEYRAKLLSEGTDWQDKVVRELRASDRILYYVVPKRNKKFEEKAYLWDISSFCFQNKLDDELDESNDEYCDFPDLAHGYTLKIRFSEEKLGTNTFAECSRIDFEDRDNPYDEEEIRALPSLDNVLDIKDYKEVTRILVGAEVDEDDEYEEPKADARPLRRSVAPREEETDLRPVRRSRPASEPEPEPEEEVVEEPVERPRPRIVRPVEPDPELTVAAPRTVVRRTAPANGGAAAVSDTTERCPHGHRFGKDCDQFTDCEDCDIWAECAEMTTSGAAA
jgi:hypothetical protein